LYLPTKHTLKDSWILNFDLMIFSVCDLKIRLNSFVLEIIRLCRCQEPHVTWCMCKSHSLSNTEPHMPYTAVFRLSLSLHLHNSYKTLRGFWRYLAQKRSHMHIVGGAMSNNFKGVVASGRKHFLFKNTLSLKPLINPLRYFHETWYK
jgi:hypothetical protein